MSNFLAIDQGTTSSRAIVFNSQLNAINRFSKRILFYLIQMMVGLKLILPIY